MKKGITIFVLLFFVLFFAAVYADPAMARKVRSDSPEQEVSKKQQVKTVKKDGAKAKRQKKAKRSGQRKTRIAKTNSSKSAKVKKETTHALRPEAQDVASGLSDDDEYIKYRLRRGETLEKVAKKFNVDTEEIVDLNSTKKKRLKAGSVVFIPKADQDLEDEPVVLSDRPLTPWKNSEEQGILVKVAKSFAGAPYKYGGNSIRGLDCSAFVKKMYEIFEVELPRSAREQYCAGPRVDRDELITGDLVFFRTKRSAKYPTHVGIYIGDDKFIHASSLLSRGVKIDCLSDNYYSRTYTGAVRVKAPPPHNKSEAEHGAGGSMSNS